MAGESERDLRIRRPPDPPDPPQWSRRGSTWLELHWVPPRRCYGNPLQEYALEMRVEPSKSEDDWQEVAIVEHIPDEKQLSHGGTYSMYHRLENLPPQTKLRFRIKAKNAVGWGAWSKQSDRMTTMGEGKGLRKGEGTGRGKGKFKGAGHRLGTAAEAEAEAEAEAGAEAPASQSQEDGTAESAPKAAEEEAAAKKRAGKKRKEERTDALFEAAFGELGQVDKQAVFRAQAAELEAKKKKKKGAEGEGSSSSAAPPPAAAAPPAPPTPPAPPPPPAAPREGASKRKPAAPRKHAGRQAEPDPAVVREQVRAAWLARFENPGGPSAPPQPAGSSPP